MMWNRKRNQDQGSGIHNTGTMTGVQNQPGAFGSIQSQGPTAPDPGTLQHIADALTRLRTALDAQQGQITTYDSCVTLIELAAEQPLDQPTGQSTATSVLTRIRELCAGAPELVGMATAVLGLIAALQT
jgi:hypothetical protein